MTRKTMAHIAAEHHKAMLKQYDFSTFQTITIYDTFSKKVSKINDNHIPVIITSNDTVTEIVNCPEYQDTDFCSNVICALNFASFTSPGGGFLSGMTTQEESLCHHSPLYEIISKEPAFYEYNRKHCNYGAYENRALLSFAVPFEKNNKNNKCDIITCAAPNLRSGYPFDNSKILRSRIEFVLDIAEENCVDVLILGAWGCGVFMQNPHEVASIFKELLKNHKYKFSKVIFAIPPGENYDVFYKIFNGTE